MVELEQDDFRKILPLYQAEDKCLPLILAVIQQKQRGWVFVDQPDGPVSAMVITNFGFMQTFGAERSESFDADLVNFFTRLDGHMPSYLLWYSPPPQWQSRLDVFAPERVRRRERARFIFHKQRADYLADLVEAPLGFDLRLLDDDLIAKTDVFKLDIGSRFWASADDFLKNGFGVCLIKDDEIASLCYSSCVVDGLAEIDIVTWDEYRGQGLAAMVARQFIRECIQRKITPTWDCFLSNVASVKLAEKLGFEQEQTYLFYSFNVPLSRSEGQKESANEMD